MNYLVHLYLAGNSDELIVGNFIGDFVKGRLGDRYATQITKGIRLHRKIDSYTDSHPVISRSKKLVSRYRRRYAGIIIDICFDHFLAKNWNDYSSEKFDDFVARICSALRRYEYVMPPPARGLLPAIENDDWLGRYRYIDQLSLVFAGISKRLKRKNPLQGSEDELIINYSAFENNFRLFFPQLIDHSQDLKRKL